MIITRLKINNLYCFKNAELDLTYNDDLSENTIDFEHLPKNKNFRYKRVCIISGANASGKSVLFKILHGMINFIYQDELSPYLTAGILKENSVQEKASIELEFTYPEEEKPKLYLYKLSFPDNTSRYHESEISCISINENDDINNCRKNLNNKNNLVFNIKADSISKKNLINLNNLLNSEDTKNFLKSPHSKNLNKEKMKLIQSLIELTKNNLTPNLPKINFAFLQSMSNIVLDWKKKPIDTEEKELFEKILKTFDPSIKRITESKEGNLSQKESIITNYNIYLNNNDIVQLNTYGNILNGKEKLSTGTLEAINMSRFITYFIRSQENSTIGGLYLLDETMAFSHSELERTIINLLIQKLEQNSQLFYSTHNYEIYTMALPLHSFVFLRRNKNHLTEFIYPEKKCKDKKDDLLNQILNDVFRTLPKTTLIDSLL